MRQFFLTRRIGVAVVAGVVLSLGVLALAQNQTTSTSQSQSTGGNASSSASASSKSQAGGGVSGGQFGTATGAVAGAPVKGTMYLVVWTPNLSAKAGPDAVSQHQEYVKTYGKQYGILLEGILGGEEPGRMAVVQGNPQMVREIAANSPLVANGFATYEIKPYGVEYSRVGVIADKGDLPNATDGQQSSSSQSSQTSQQSTGSSGSGGN